MPRAKKRRKAEIVDHRAREAGPALAGANVEPVPRRRRTVTEYIDYSIQWSAAFNGPGARVWRWGFGVASVYLICILARALWFGQSSHTAWALTLLGIIFTPMTLFTYVIRAELPGRMTWKLLLVSGLMIALSPVHTLIDRGWGGEAHLPTAFLYGLLVAPGVLTLWAFALLFIVPAVLGLRRTRPQSPSEAAAHQP